MENTDNIEAGIPNVEDSILSSIKKMLGITEDYEQFDLDVKIHINSAFITLAQIGVGPKEGFSITDRSNTWSEFKIKTQSLDSVKNYIYLRTKILFDPPTSSMVLDAYKEQIRELEFRLQISEDTPEKEESDGN